MKNFELGKDVRRAWHELVTVVELEGLPWTEKETGYVLIPQWGAEPREVLELWVGVKLDGTERIPAGADVLHIPADTIDRFDFDIMVAIKD